MVENRVVGLKSRGVYETPGGTVLMIALRDLEGITLDPMALRERIRAGEMLADLIYRGFWFTPVRAALDALSARLMAPVTGEVALELYKGSVRSCGRRSPTSLYDGKLSTFGAGASYDPADAGGFIRLLGMPLAAEASRGALTGESRELSQLMMDAAALSPIPGS
jgi:argininosuccinate synthase